MPYKEPKWRQYERAIARLEEAWGNCDVIYDKRIVGRRSRIERQVDIWLSGTLGRHEVTIAVECRRYEHPLGIKDVEAFYGFLDDVGANKGVLFSASGFTNGAKKRADGSNIELQLLTPEEAEDFDWGAYLRDRCQGLDCWGTISWDEMLCDEGGGSTLPPYLAGFCDTCSSLHIACGNCGSIDQYVEERMIQCLGCEACWELNFEKGDVIGIRQVNP